MTSPRPTALSPAAVAWLQAVLRERHGDTLTLAPADGGVLALRLDGHPGRIVFGTPDPAFLGQGQDMPCTTWDPAAEGLMSVLGSPLPMPGLGTPPERVVEKNGDGHTVHYDLPGLVFWMLTRAEEVGRTDLDRHGRFPSTASHARRHGYLSRPVVDEWLAVLGQVMQRTWPGLALREHTFRMRPSHDVDFPSQYAFRTGRSFVREIGLDLLRRRNFADAARGPLIRWTSGRRLRRADPANTFDWLMRLSDRHGTTSAFYFICGRTDPQFDAAYEPENAAIVDLMKGVHARGHEIGLHPSYGTYRTPAAIAGEAARLRRVCEDHGIRQSQWGGRMHYLRWETPTTLQGWEQAGMAYDSTLGYADCAGFRCGTSHEYPAFDPVADRALGLRIRPLVAMEGTIMAPGYMGLGDGPEAEAALVGFKSACRAFGGNFTLLWHNSELSTPRVRALYEAVLAH